MVKIDFVNATEPAINDTNLNQMQLNIENAINAQVSGDTLPVGSIMPFGSDTVPENWLLCDGQAVSRTTYALLFSIIGTTYGVGDGSTTFNLPDLKRRVPTGKDTTDTDFDTLGKTGGEKTHTHTMENAWADVGVTSSGTLYQKRKSGSGESFEPSHSTSGQATTPVTSITYGTEIEGSTDSSSNMSPYQVTNYIIKAQQSAGVVATVVDNLTSTSQTDALSAKQGKVLNDSITTVAGDITSINNKFVYSTTETVIGTYINKPLYRKILVASATEGSNVPIAHSISNLKSIIHQEINCTNSAGNTYPQHNDIYDLYIKDTDAQNVWCKISGAFSGWSVIVTLEYTKTTD